MATYQGRGGGGSSGPPDPEAVQDNIGALLAADGGDLDWTYNDGAGSFSCTIKAAAITNAKLANMATATFKGRTTAGTGDPEDLTISQATALLNVATNLLKGLVPATGGGTKKFLRSDLSFEVPLNLPQQVSLGGLIASGGSGLTNVPDGAGSSFNFTANRLYKYMLRVPVDFLVTTMAIQVASAVAGNVRCGIRNMVKNSDGSYKFGTLVAETSALDSTTTGLKTYTPGSPFTLDAGLYCVEVLSDATCSLRGCTSGMNTFGVNPATSTNGIGGCYRSYTYGTLPADETALAAASLSYLSSNAAVPHVMLY